MKIRGLGKGEVGGEVREVRNRQCAEDAPKDEKKKEKRKRRRCKEKKTEDQE
jgi:hypothetical protein